MRLRRSNAGARQRIAAPEEGENGGEPDPVEQQLAPAETCLGPPNQRVAILVDVFQMKIRSLETHNMSPKSDRAGAAAIPPSCQNKPPDAAIFAATWSLVSSRMRWHRSVPANSPPPFTASDLW